MHTATVQARVAHWAARIEAAITGRAFCTPLAPATTGCKMSRMEGLSEETRLLLLLLPLVIIELVGKIAALVSVARTPREQVRSQSRMLWVLLIVLVNFAGWIAWFLAGRKRA